MTLERIHLFALSLAIRGVGVYFAYVAGAELATIVGNFDVWKIIGLSALIHAALAVYFLFGAPPALKWVQRIPKAD